ncbi:protein Njmu-R1 isoform X1 [Aplysia californica]|uniref:Protein Njmu-R1 isoform X1 n=1 Tax=Aplysia californica TaxID=6500 RepID=A0ABM0JSV2_APLCA|nr:protein Njmu-R1 isoform X1 [Aplysia californica]
MAESSDSGSVLSLQTDTAAEKKSEEEKRFYALYSFNAKRGHGADDPASPESGGDTEEGSTCLSVAATNLAAHTETDLRKSLSYKLLSKTRPYGEGHVFSVGLSFTDSISTSASCYYCILKSSSDSLGFDHVTQDGVAEAGGDNDCQEFVVCFISFLESSLDLFRTELDEYSQGLTPLLDKEPLVPRSSSGGNLDSLNNASSNTSAEATQPKELSQLGAGIQSYLEQWPPVVLGFLTRTLQCMGPEIQQLIYAALLNANLQVSGASAQLEQDIKKFFQCCSLSGLLEKPQSDNTSSLTSLDNCDQWQLQPVVVSVTVKDGTASFEKTYSCQFCKNVTDKLMAQDQSNVTNIRDFLESIKLAFAHNLNKLKRFLGQAEVDFYVLYRALSYLRKCGCGELLLRYVKLDASSETLSVVSVLETFIKEMKQTLS